MTLREPNLIHFLCVGLGEMNQ